MAEKKDHGTKKDRAPLPGKFIPAERKNGIIIEKRGVFIPQKKDKGGGTERTGPKKKP